MLEHINPEGLIPLLGGIYALLMARGVIPKNPKNPQAMQEWREKYGNLLKWAAPALIIFGCLQLFRVL